MIDPVTPGRRPPVSPQLALRVAALGVVAFALFAVIFFRLWYLQVLSGDQYLAQAQTNKVRVQPLPAPRGDIVDRNGDPIVSNRSAIVVKIKPESLPQSEKDAVLKYGADRIERAKKPKGSRGDQIPAPPVPPDLQLRFRRLAQTLGMSTGRIQELVVRGLFLAGYAPIVIKTDVDEDVRGYIAERQDEFPGVTVDNAFLREYPQGELAAQLLGTVSQISPAELKSKTFRGVPAGSIVGQTGIERQYDKFLRGRDGKERLLVDAQGNPRGEGVRVEPKPGNNVQLTLDLKLQQAATKAFTDVAGDLKGAFVVMDPRGGAVYAMGSFPSFDPSVLARPITQKRYDEIFNVPGATPQFNRATGANYSTGSTFKPFTALGALESKDVSTGTVVNDQGCIQIDANRTACNAGKTPFGPVDLRQAIRVSSDVYFYSLGLKTNTDAPRGGPIQKAARQFGFGRATGIDLPIESVGNVPDAAWRRRVAKQEEEYERKNKVPCCTISDKRAWSIGDNVNLSIGQGDLQATPLQMATAYAGLANGGKVPRPHLGLEVQDDKGIPISPITTRPGRRIDIPGEYRSTIMAGLHDAASAQGGTSADVFGGWNQSGFPVFGKTGTVQVDGKNDQSWYVAYSYKNRPDDKPLVVAVTVEEGGFGAARAAPIACRIMKSWFGAKYNKQAGCTPGSSTSL
ncbi:MAG: hypothetical protein JWM31_1671 [Solirubrobacterales bacterium]|nr:hypothetical protein [Solirubrobacterales bacterium]